MKITYLRRFPALAAVLSLCTAVGVLATCGPAQAEPGTAAATKAAPETVAVYQTGKMVVPASIKRVKPANNVIEHEFEARVGEGDDAQTARVTLMPAMGGVKANIDRWIGQFSGPQRKVSETKQTKSGDW